MATNFTTKKRVWQQQIIRLNTFKKMQSTAIEPVIVAECLPCEQELPTKMKCKKISFHPTAFVVLIPTAEEYHKAGLGKNLWWNELEYRGFKLSAMLDLKEYMRKFPQSNNKDLLKAYYEHVLTDDIDTAGTPCTPNSVAELADDNIPSKHGSPARNQLNKADNVPPPILRTDSVQLYRGREEEHFLIPEAAMDDKLPSDLISAMDDCGDASPTISEIRKSEEMSSSSLLQSQSRAVLNSAGFLPLVANAATMIFLALVQHD